MSNNPRPIYGPDAFKLNTKEARELGFRIFRATRSCGCCKVDMAFRSLQSVERQFQHGVFADVVHDDMGNVYEAVNTGRGFVEIKTPGPKPKRRVPILPILVPRPEMYTHLPHQAHV